LQDVPRYCSIDIFSKKCKMIKNVFKKHKKYVEAIFSFLLFNLVFNIYSFRTV
jgi:hypothetical protein